MVYWTLGVCGAARRPPRRLCLERLLAAVAGRVASYPSSGARLEHFGSQFSWKGSSSLKALFLGSQSQTAAERMNMASPVVLKVLAPSSVSEQQSGEKSELPCTSNSSNGPR